MRQILVVFLQARGLPAWLVPDYWFMLTVAIVAGCVMTLVLWRQAGQKASVASDLMFWAIPLLFVGTKVFYFLQFGFPKGLDWWSSGGASFYGGLFGILTAWGLYYLLRPYPLLLFLDSAAPPLAFGLFLGRIGCFLAGCNGGIPSNLPWALQFPRWTPVYYSQIQAGLIAKDADSVLPVHPTQLYESLFGLVAFAALLFLLRRKQWHGQVFFTGMLWYAVYRFATEPLRSDHAGGLHPFEVLSFAQFISLIVGAAALIGLWLIRRRGLLESATA